MQSEVAADTGNATSRSGTAPLSTSFMATLHRQFTDADEAWVEVNAPRRMVQWFGAERVRVPLQSLLVEFEGRVEMLEQPPQLTIGYTMIAKGCRVVRLEANGQTVSLTRHQPVVAFYEPKRAPALRPVGPWLRWHALRLLGRPERERVTIDCRPQATCTVTRGSI